mmetsp:Transcript_22845/g.70888  ORF Transcript_22845/g.70888 Transcript_22845/m.70888 type:complete len:277 (-) Transcript_22845:599-1429(-)
MAATPGSVAPPRSSSVAPPPVLTCDISEATPIFSTAATESPPPTMLVQPAPVSSASLVAMASVPWAKASNSKTPRGPFQMMVLAVASVSAMAATVAGPASRPIQPSRMPPPSAKEMTSFSASALNSAAAMTSVGTISVTPSSSALVMMPEAVAIKSSSTSEAPTSLPWALRNVKARPPPSTRMFTFSTSAVITGSLLLTLAPPMMAASGRSASSRRRKASSFSMSLPVAQQSAPRIVGTPTVDACARCAVPKASFTYTSASDASWVAKAFGFAEEH